MCDPRICEDAEVVELFHLSCFYLFVCLFCHLLPESFHAVEEMFQGCVLYVLSIDPQVNSLAKLRIKRVT